MAGLGAALFVLIGIWYILQVIGYWKIFQKAGKPGWHSIIPILNVYDEFDICWKGFYGLLMMVALAVGSAFSNGGSEGGNTSVVAAVCGILVLVLGIVGNYKLAKCFGKGIGTFLGLVFLEPLFMIILGFGSAEYQGRQ
jgi:hypothetical protein